MWDYIGNINKLLNVLRTCIDELPSGYKSLSNHAKALFVYDWLGDKK